MTLQIDLSEEDESRIECAAKAMGMAREEYVRHKLLEGPLALEALSDVELEEIRAGIRRGLADVRAGRLRDIGTWAAEKRAKYGDPPTEHPT